MALEKGVVKLKELTIFGECNYTEGVSENEAVVLREIPSFRDELYFSEFQVSAKFRFLSIK